MYDSQIRVAAAKSWISSRTLFCVHKFVLQDVRDIAQNVLS